MNHFKIILLFFYLMLSSIVISAQKKIKCNQCKNGVYYWTATLDCKNCKDWADSYRKIKGCDVCKNNQYIKSNKQGKCMICKGTGWVSPVTIVPTREELIFKRIKDFGIEPHYQIGYFELHFVYTQLDIIKKRMKYYMADNLWNILARIMTRDISYRDYGKDKINALVDYYEWKYEQSEKTVDWPGRFEFYPSPGEVALIRAELAKLDADPDYNPYFFGGSISAYDLSQIF
jgi:hypothetical protein